MYFGSPKAWTLSVLGVALLMGNCAWAIDMGNDSLERPESLSQVSATCPQYGEITGEATFFPRGSSSEVVINLEIAETQPQQRCGLMFRDRLPDNRGMGFPFDPPEQVSFWMKDVPVALDMVFVTRIPNNRPNRPESKDAYKVLDIITAPPCANDPCPTYGPAVQVAWVIELGEGQAEAIGLQKGDRLHIQRSQPQ